MQITSEVRGVADAARRPSPHCPLCVFAHKAGHKRRSAALFRKLQPLPRSRMHAFTGGSSEPPPLVCSRCFKLVSAGRLHIFQEFIDKCTRKRSAASSSSSSSSHIEDVVEQPVAHEQQRVAHEPAHDIEMAPAEHHIAPVALHQLQSLISSLRACNHCTEQVAALVALLPPISPAIRTVIAKSDVAMALVPASGDNQIEPETDSVRISFPAHAKETPNEPADADSMCDDEPGPDKSVIPMNGDEQQHRLAVVDDNGDQGFEVDLGDIIELSKAGSAHSGVLEELELELAPNSSDDEQQVASSIDDEQQVIEPDLESEDLERLVAEEETLAERVGQENAGQPAGELEADKNGAAATDDARSLTMRDVARRCGSLLPHQPTEHDLARAESIVNTKLRSGKAPPARSLSAALAISTMMGPAASKERRHDVIRMCELAAKITEAIANHKPFSKAGLNVETRIVIATKIEMAQTRGERSMLIRYFGLNARQVGRMIALTKSAMELVRAFPHLSLNRKRWIGAGRRPVVSPEIEEAVRSAVMEVRREGAPITQQRLAVLATVALRKKYPDFGFSASWVRGWMARTRMSLRAATSSKSVDDAELPEVAKFLRMMAAFREHFSSNTAHLINMDETYVAPSIEGRSTIDEKGAERVYVQAEESKFHCTCALTTDFTGDFLNLCAIFHARTNEHRANLHRIEDVVDPATGATVWVARTPKAWITGEVMQGLLEKYRAHYDAIDSGKYHRLCQLAPAQVWQNFALFHFMWNSVAANVNDENKIPKIDAGRTMTVLAGRLPIFLVLDNAKSHFTAPVTAKALSLGICLVPLPPNTTHFLQPVDNMFNASFKAKCRVRWDDVWMIHLFLRKAALAGDASSLSKSKSSSTSAFTSTSSSSTSSSSTSSASSSSASTSSASTLSSSSSSSSTSAPTASSSSSSSTTSASATDALHVRVPPSAVNLNILNGTIAGDQLHSAFAHKPKPRKLKPSEVVREIRRRDGVMVQAALDDDCADVMAEINEHFRNFGDPALETKVAQCMKGTKAAFRETMTLDVIVHAHQLLAKERAFTQSTWLTSLFRVDAVVLAAANPASSSSASPLTAAATANASSSR